MCLSSAEHDIKDLENLVTSGMAWERLGVPPEELEEVGRDRDVWVSLLKLLPPRPDLRTSGR